MNYPGIIKKGSTDAAAVKAVKAQLNAVLKTTFNTDSAEFGEQTEEAVKRFQNIKQLKPDGVVGELTWARLFGTASPLPSSSTIAGNALRIAATQLGVREATGHNDGPAVESYLRSVGLGKGYAWCASFVYWCFNQAAKEAGVPNPLPQTGGVLDHLSKTKGAIVHTPQPGDVFIMDFGEGKGHTGIVKEVRADKIFTIEGNTNIEGSRNGDGVYERSRNISSIKAFIRY